MFSPDTIRFSTDGWTQTLACKTKELLKLTTALLIRSISTVWLSITHVGVEDTLLAVSTWPGAQATPEAGGLGSSRRYSRTAHLIRAVVAVSTTVTNQALGDAAPAVLTPEVSYIRVNSEDELIHYTVFKTSFMASC